MFKVGDKVKRKSEFETAYRWDVIVNRFNRSVDGVFEVEIVCVVCDNSTAVKLKGIEGGYIFDAPHFDLVLSSPTMIEYWEVNESYDRDSHVVARFSSEYVATQYKNKKNSHYLSVGSKKTLTIFDSLEQLAEYSAEAVKKRALEKLTKEERAALGL